VPLSQSQVFFAAAAIRSNLRRRLVFNQQRTGVKNLKDCRMKGQVS
jgi:hypothetical protein